MSDEVTVSLKPDAGDGTRTFIVAGGWVGNRRWDGWDSTFDFQWLRDGVPIEGATSYAYTTTDEDDGTEITLRSKRRSSSARGVDA